MRGQKNEKEGSSRGGLLDLGELRKEENINLWEEQAARPEQGKAGKATKHW